MFEDLKINKVVIETQGIEDYWKDKDIKTIEITKLYEHNKGNLASKFKLITSHTDLTLNDFCLTEDGYAIYTSELEYK